MIAATKNGLPAFAAISALQKWIRRSREREAMEFATELMHSRQALHTMAWNRLVVISHEEIDSVRAPYVVPYVATCRAQAFESYKKAKAKSKTGDPENPGFARMIMANAVRMLCRAPKSRVANHLGAACGLRELLHGYVPVIPDWAMDMHTAQGKRRGRGLEHFRYEAARLFEWSDEDEDNPLPVGEDEYTEEAFLLFTEKKLREGGRRAAETAPKELPPSGAEVAAMGGMPQHHRYPGEKPFTDEPVKPKPAKEAATIADLFGE